MARYRVLFWGTIPAQLKIFDGDARPISVPLAEWFMQEIDRVAMREGLIGSDAYLDRWSWSEELERPGPADQVARELVSEIEAEWASARRGGRNRAEETGRGE